MDDPRPRDRSEERVVADVQRHGWHVVLIPEEDGMPGWAFTVGLSKTFGHPEVIVFGLHQEVAHFVLNDVGERVRAGLKIVDGTRAEELLEGVTCAFRPVARCWHRWFLGMASWFNGGNHRYSVFQCLWPDRAGCFPWDDDFRASWRWAQPLLFEADVDRARCRTLVEKLARARGDDGAA